VAVSGFKPRPHRLGYAMLVLFMFLYYWRPEDLIPGLSWIPMAKVTGGIALLALIFGSGGMRRQKLPLEIKVLLLLLFYMVLTIPFAYWRGGAFNTVVNKFSKGVIVALLLSLMVTEVQQMRKLLSIQLGAVAFVTFVSMAIHHTDKDGRLSGVQKSILENPNDLAINLAMNFPICMAFLLGAKGAPRKLLWGVSLAVMLLGTILTYSRSGLIAMVITVLGCIWEYGIKGKRKSVLVGALALGMVGTVVILATPNYVTRIRSLFSGNIQGSNDRGSLEGRRELLVKSIQTALDHPIFGVGPGNFEVIDGQWRVAHNSYTELAAEAGFPALGLFLLLLVVSFRKINAVRKLPAYQTDESIRLWTSGMWTSLAAYAAGSMFASTEYNLFPYIMVGYISALYQIAKVSGGEVTAPDAENANKNRFYGRNRKLEYRWSR
jgi:O-antigen ligase